MVNENTIVKAIGRDAGRRVGRLAAELVRAESDRKEAVLAELEFFRWLEKASGLSQKRSARPS